MGVVRVIVLVEECVVFTVRFFRDVPVFAVLLAQSKTLLHTDGLFSCVFAAPVVFLESHTLMRLLHHCLDLLVKDDGLDAVPLSYPILAISRFHWLLHELC